MLQQGLQIIGATKNEQMVISIVPYITLYYAIYPQHASRKSNSDYRVILVQSKADGQINEVLETGRFEDLKLNGPTGINLI